MSAALVVLVGLVGWEALVRAGAVDALILPAPTDIAQSLWTDRAILGEDLAVTAGEVVLGLAAAILMPVKVAGSALGASSRRRSLQRLASSERSSLRASGSTSRSPS